MVVQVVSHFCLSLSGVEERVLVAEFAFAAILADNVFDQRIEQLWFLGLKLWFWSAKRNVLVVGLET